MNDFQNTYTQRTLVVKRPQGKATTELQLNRGKIYYAVRHLAEFTSGKCVDYRDIKGEISYDALSRMIVNRV